MNINLHFSHVEVPDYLRMNIEGHIAEMFGEMANKSNLQVDLYCKKESLTVRHTSGKFKCHVKAFAPWLRKTVYTQATGDECWDTIIDASEKLKRQVLKNKKSNQRKRGKTERERYTSDIPEHEIAI